jgi:hypothetical protein
MIIIVFIAVDIALFAALAAYLITSSMRRPKCRTIE